MKYMWRLEDLLKWSNTANINERWVPARPLNFKPKYCSLWNRIKCAWQVVLGKTETFVWPENQ